ncbi:MAG: bifunctional phosphoribosyl-AMP cyclohydrolase/phosphoribosyl-ATP diphosphatase HisIE [Helicobacter sp.]|uniref:Histidine biosynthesis bifunctional protein HisIE n=1 Tax=Helicobacter colisuis TaxID=2949739 RepID=A0ABT0TSJ6_9HELI|nr:bifunctional phosphoribosyl-AMP cyclohydrolase/phosphoribosyl-ATP diphosphatase HisIE [Helicobacter sp.]MCI2236525.1 bifunctional phosphoribosyl-AMP cyclohydrolase/phosphoribosyl-ATP diphosphatase HisIE [Helicobacter sp. CaF467b]MCL9818890.1 bifunctional phosphoribosyl-AMP cyclohydrolase/phosphoribosyl-ATP diphosphatase HisIE [Helicobacter colisuis]MDY4426012.1 bifunctional phosphoribosyl-AMP cyclohydrolase/phosphoribosyl-ATP diphosphatase HisIE [Helicobacter sp.]MDY5615741.1 bifunctional ph
MNILETIAWDKLQNGLIPAITQDYLTNEVLMLAFMNKEALELSLQSGYAHYFSRTKNRLWKKGEQSGHTQEIIECYLDCDKDTLLLKVKQEGVACHTGNQTCFFNQISLDTITQKSQNTIDTSKLYGAVDTLYHTLLERKNANPNTSYTASLFHKGENTIAKKIVEEAAELGFAIKDKESKDIIYEAADLLYHSLVGLAYRDLSPDLVKQEIIRRFGLSGIEEKNSREK